MTFRGTAFREGDHICLNGTADNGCQVGGERLDRFMEEALRQAVVSGQEVMISVVDNPQGVRVHPQDDLQDRLPAVEGQDDIASIF